MPDDPPLRTPPPPPLSHDSSTAQDDSSRRTITQNIQNGLSAFLAGMKRSTGLTFKTDRVAGESKDLNKWIDNYLGVGEWVMDQSVAIAGSSGYFERTR
ncbi:uncharacterized protein J7T54_004062 [Emericellopsis cladophorae]|uniref:Uncharacterized protein n=1 Tax=Emericellopsis cladophorae TaxID=2686198 RepID=A0A9P9Y1M5_9HYPO|nr:uncharacterized protein J7T54_004062 [Emericellopsis cladophorae]KAI6781289.1 hypothetical protein J7T54_004062 [Emericellopsis cladophorae]